MSRLLHDPEALRARHQELRSSKKSRRPDGRDTEALAECCLRLAVHPSTPVAESFDLLHYAFKIDGSNPKYAYHIARIYFVHGELKQASRWLLIATRLCPTSHRIWAHVSLLQRELNAIYHGNDSYEPDALRKYSEKIAEAIKSGKDSLPHDLLAFEPPPSRAALEREQRQKGGSNGQPRAPKVDELAQAARDRVAEAKRFLHAKQCRWSGINDLTIEQMLESTPSKRNLKVLAALLQQAAEVANVRRNGVQAFAILAIQFIVSGYPVTTIRRLSKALLPEASASSMKLLELVCSIYEAEERDLPRILSEAVESGQMPPMLATLIHKRRLLWRPLEFRSIITYRAAKKFIAASSQDAPANEGVQKNQTDRANEYARRLIRAIEALNPNQPVPFEDVLPEEKPEPVDLGTVQQQFVNLFNSARKLEQLRNEAFLFLKGELAAIALSPSDDAQYSLACADREAMREIKAALKSAGEQGIKRLNTLLKVIANLDSSQMPESFNEEKEQCDKLLKGLCNLGNFEKVLQRIDGHLLNAGEQFRASTMPCSLRASKILDDITSALQSDVSSLAEAQPASAGNIQALLEKAEEMKSKLDEAWSHLKAILAGHKEEAFSETEQAEILMIRQSFENVMAECGSRLQDIAQQRASGAIVLQELPQFDLAEKQFQAIQQRRGPFMRNLSKLPQPDTRRDRGAAAMADEKRNEGGENADKTTAQLTGLPALESAIARVDHEIARRFKEANESFDPYSPRAKHLPSIRAVRLSVRSREAETFYRLGKRKAARRIWSEMLKEDWLDLKVLKNIAVCDTSEGETRNALASWRTYLEALYFYDIVAGSPRPYARPRADSHRAFGSAFAPAFLFEKLDAKWSEKIDHEAARAFFGSPGCVRNFVNHKLLEFLNARMDFSSPPLILGVSRSEGEQVRAEARERLLPYIEKVSSLLPERVLDRFAALSKRYVEQAYTACSTSKRLTLRKDPHYAEEETRQMQLIVEICHLKFKLFTMVRSDKDLARHLSSIDFLQHLFRLDDIPLAQSPEFLRAAAGSLGIEDTSQLLETMKNLGEYVIYIVLSFIFADDDPADEALRNHQYKRLVNEWVKKPACSDYLDFIDDPQRFYPAAVVTALNKSKATPEAVASLRAWHNRFPEITGPARYLGFLLNQAGKYKETILIMDKAISKGFHKAGVTSCYYCRMQSWHGCGAAASQIKNREEALRCFKKSLSDAVYIINNSKNEREVSAAKEMQAGLKQWF